MAQGSSQGQEMSSSPGLTSSAQGFAQTTAPVQASDERVFKQSEVNEIVKRAKNDTEERVKRIYSEQPDYAARKYGDLTPSHQTRETQQSSLTEDQARKIAAEEAQRLHDQRTNEARTRSETDAAQRIVGTFWNKLEAGRAKFKDFDSVTSDIEYAQFPNVVHVLSELDNADEVMYELGKNPMNLASLELLASKSLKKGVLQAQRLSQSIKDNNAAGKVKVPNEPLTQLRPTNLGTDNGVMSVSDFRKKYRG